MHGHMEQTDRRPGPCPGEAWIDGRYQTRQHGEGTGHPKEEQQMVAGGAGSANTEVCPRVKWSDWRRAGVRGRHPPKASPGGLGGLELRSVLREGTQVNVGTGR